MDPSANEHYFRKDYQAIYTSQREKNTEHTKHCKKNQAFRMINNKRRMTKIFTLWDKYAAIELFYPN